VGGAVSGHAELMPPARSYVSEFSPLEGRGVYGGRCAGAGRASRRLRSIVVPLKAIAHIFTLSRVREAVDRGEPTEVAVRRSIALTAGVVVVAAAAVMIVCVFALFGTLSPLELKQAGICVRRPFSSTHSDPRSAPARNDEAARRLRLVPAAVAEWLPRLEPGELISSSRSAGSCFGVLLKRIAATARCGWDSWSNYAQLNQARVEPLPAATGLDLQNARPLEVRRLCAGR
jgi:hypothetical protein